MIYSCNKHNYRSILGVVAIIVFALVAFTSNVQAVEGKLDQATEIKTVTTSATQMKRSSSSIMTSKRIAATPVVRAVRPTAIDERPLWDLFHQGKVAEAKKSFEQLKKENPDWQPSSDLTAAIQSTPAAQKHSKVNAAPRANNIDRQLKRHAKSKKWSSAVSIYKKQPGQFNCKHAYRRMYISEALIHLQREPEAQALYATTIKQCRDADRVAALEHAQGRLDVANVGPLLKKIRTRPPASRYKSRVNAVAFRFWVNLDQEGNHPEALIHINEMLPEMEALNDPSIHETIAWMNLNHEQFDAAVKHFRISRTFKDSDSALKGELIALHGAGKSEEMKALMKQEKMRLDRMNALQDLLPLLAASCGLANDAECLLATLKKIEAFRPLNAGEEEARTWIDYNQERFTKAANTFERLYRAKQTLGVAKGLFVSLMRLGQTSRATHLGDELGGPFQDILTTGDAERFYMRKLFHAAQDYDESFNEALLNLDSDYVRLSFMKRRRGGNKLTPSLDQFTQRKMVLEGGVFKGKKHLFSIIYEPTQIDVGVPIIKLGDNFGSNPIIPTATIYPIETRYTGYEWSLGYRYEDWRSWYGSIGQGFVHGRSRPTFKGKLGFKEQYLGGFVQAELFRQPIRSSFLSYAGMIDPFTNRTWGRVSRTGAQVTGYSLTGIPDVGFTYFLRAEKMQGVSVKKNRHFQLIAFVPYHFEWFQDTEWSVGPLYQWESYNNDQGHYMVGHGGYFSPQNNHYFGLNARFISREADLYNYEFRAFAGLQVYSTKTTPLLPLSPDGRVFLGKQLREKMYQVQGKVVRDLPWNLQLGGSVAWSNSFSKNRGGGGALAFNNYQELLLSVFLTWHPEDRGEVMSSDHPFHGIDTLY